MRELHPKKVGERYFIQMRLGGNSISVTRNSEKECKAQAELLRAEYYANKPRKPIKKQEPIILNEAIELYIKSRSNILSPSTIRGYETIRKNRFKKLMGKKVYSITDKEWVQACNEEARLCSAKTLTNAWRFIATVLNEQCDIKPPKIKLPQIAPNERKFLEPEQIKIFIDAVHDTVVEIPALLALSSLRRSEICALSWENIDFENRRIKVCGAAVFDENQKIVYKKENKNKSSTRYVPILMNELYQALKSCDEKMGLIVKCFPNTIYEQINRICKNSGLPEVGVHGLRHSFASLAYHLNVPEKIVMEIGGWSDNQTMHKIYTHIAKSDMKRYETQMTDFYKSINKL